MTRALVVGYGSIGIRHAQWLKELDCDVAVLSGRAIEFPRLYKALDEALSTHDPDYVVIANTTAQHESTLRELLTLRFQGKILVEKPLFKDSTDLALPTDVECYVAYNLRFHPLLQRLRSLLNDRKAIQVQIEVGKYLPTWRPGEAIRYSGNAEQGGGVLRDLSHELDYVSWIFGAWKKVTAIKGHYSHLNLTSEDAASLLIETEHASMVSLQLNYLDRIGRRHISIQTDEVTIHADLLTGRLQVNEHVENINIDRSFTYLAQHCAVLSGDTSSLCSYSEGLKTVQLIEAAERAAVNINWSRV
jgi:predicted dehydrogenase